MSPFVKTVPPLVRRGGRRLVGRRAELEHCSIGLPQPFSRPSAGVETRRELAVLLVGIDWAERHHDVCVMAADGRVLARERITDGVAGVARLHELIASWAEEPAEMVVGIETDRGLLVGAVKVLARGHQQLVWARQRQANMLPSALRAFYPAAVAAFGGDPGGRDAVAVLGLAPGLSWAGCCRMPSKPRWPASSWRPRRWWRLPTAKWWRPRWRSLPT